MSKGKLSIGNRYLAIADLQKAIIFHATPRGNLAAALDPW